MKFLKYFFFLIFLLSTFNALADTGCNLGNQIYPNATGTKNALGYPTYYNSNPINIRWWSEDPNCGILSTKISPSGQGACEVIGNNWGILYTFRQADNSCQTSPPMNLPLDDYTWVMLLAVGSLGVFIIIKKGIFTV